MSCHMGTQATTARYSARPTGCAVDDLVEVLGEAVADSAVVERPLGHALADAGHEHVAVGVGASVAQRDEVHHLAR